MKRPLLWALGFLVVGIIIGRAPGLAALNPVLLFSLSLGLGLVFCIGLYFLYKYKPVFALVLFLLVGLLRIGESMHSHVIEPVYVEFHGVVVDIGRTGGGNQRATVRGENFDFRIMAYIRPHQPQVVLGQEVVLTGYLQPLRGAVNPVGYNQFQHLRSQKVDATIWPEEIVLGDVSSSLMVVLRRFRDRLADVYDGILPSREAGVIKSMVLGDRLDMDQDLAGQYRMMGIFHILSISGMHVTILTMAAFSVLKMVMAERPAGVIVLIIMIAYCLMTGAAVPTVRAVTMGGVLVLGRILYRDYDLLASVSFAGIVLLIFEPLYLFNVAFQLSFGAVFGIGVLRAPIERGLALIRLPAGKFRESLSVGISAVVASYLVFAHHLYEIPLYSVIGNIVIMPTVTILLVLGVLVGLVGLFWMGLAGVIAGAVYFILRFYAMASDFFSSLPGAMTLTGGDNLAVTAAGVAVVLAFAFAFSGFGEDFRKRLTLLYVAVIILIGCVFVRDFPFDLRITVLDTWGNYSVIRHRSETLIIGSGRGGESTLLTYIDMRGVSRANGLVLSYPPRPVDVRRLKALLPRIQVLYLPEGFTIPDALSYVALSHGVELVWFYSLELGQVIVQAEAELGLRVVFGGSEVVINEEMVLFADREIYGTVLLRVNRNQIRYWIYN